MVPNIEKIPDKERAYFEKYINAIFNNPNLVDYAADALWTLISKEDAEKIFDEVILAIGKNPEKKEQYSNPEDVGDVAIGDIPIDRFETIKREFPDKKIEEYKGFLTDYIIKKEEEGYDITIIRGLRNGDDLDYEVNQLRFMRDMRAGNEYFQRYEAMISKINGEMGDYAEAEVF